MHPPAIAEHPIDTPLVAKVLPSWRPHYALAVCSAILLAFCVLATPPGAIKTAEPLLITWAVLTGPLLLPAALFHDRKRWVHRDSALMLPWTLLIALLIVQAAPISATFAFPLRDSLWHSLDQRLAINVPGIMAYARHFPAINSLLFDSYAFTLHPLLLCAILLPAITGRREAAQRFVLSNAFSFVIALPIMIFLPAIGPWIGWNFAPDKLQRACEATIVALRHGSVDLRDSFGGIVCLPSFHTFWAVASAQALFSFRYLRYPAIIVAGLITVSTVTTGWHYGIDVIAGLLLVVICTVISNGIIRGKLWHASARK